MYRFFVCLILAFSLFGCDDNKMAQDALLDIIAETEMTGIEEMSTDVKDIPVCQVGDILMPGQSCLDGSTDGMFTVLENGNGKYTSLSGILFESTDILDTEGATLNDQSYSFRSRRLNNGGWEILSDRKQLNWPLTLSVIGDPVVNDILVPVNDSSEWINDSPAAGIWEKSIRDDISNYQFPTGNLRQYVGWMSITNWDKDPELGPSYPHWFYSHAESTMIWDVSGYDVIRFEGFYLLPAYQARDTDADDGNVEITWYADDVQIYSSGKNSWEKTKENSVSELPGFYKWIIEMNFDIPQGTDQLKLHVSNSDDGVKYDHFVIINPKLYTTEPNNN